ncbi:hypothetical protein OO012_10960 [Rhodobacteraceae bacterium KMM 6894]|nr:hypothetical protein [Rhodobacteraceae bacterium KMM 6894]
MMFLEIIEITADLPGAFFDHLPGQNHSGLGKTDHCDGYAAPAKSPCHPVRNLIALYVEFTQFPYL